MLKIFSWLAAYCRRCRTGFGLAAFVLLLLLANLAGARWFHRFDLTADNLYSLAPVSQQTAKHLPSEISVTAYFSRDLPPEFAIAREQALDLLKEYAFYGDKFKLTVKDAKDDPSAEAAGIPKLQFNDVRRDKLEVVNGYLGLVLASGDKREVIPVVDNAAALEYQVTVALKRLTSDNRPQVAWIKSHGVTTDYRLAKQALGQIVELKEVDLSEVKDLTAYQLVILAGPKNEISQADWRKLEQVLMGDKALLILADRLEPTADFKIQANRSKLADWLQQYGLLVDDRLVLDENAGLATVAGDWLSYRLPYAFWPKIVNSGFDSSNPMVSRLDGVVLPWASPLSYQGRYPDQYRVLARSSAKAWLASSSATLRPEALASQTSAPRQAYELAAMLSGSLSSLDGQTQAQSARLLVVGDADFARDDFVKNNPANLTLLMNLAEASVVDDNLLDIRSKAADQRPLAAIDDAERRFWRYLNVAGLPLLVLALGALRYYFRRRTKNLSF